jgi:hypothetical protein
LARKALCVGISDYPGVHRDLPGCANDAHAWSALLVDHYDFPRADVRLLLDEQATRRGVLGALEALLAGARAGDVLVFTSAAHGTYVPDHDAGRPTCDAAICPYDYRANLILVDELRERFAKLAPGVRLAFVSDTCHFGAVSRFEPEAPARRARFLAPEEWGGRSALRARSAALHELRGAGPRGRAIVLTGCREDQYAYDAHLGGSHHGAMTYFALQAIREARYDLTWADLRARLCELLADARIPQEPKLDGEDALLKQRVFS